MHMHNIRHHMEQSSTAPEGGGLIVEYIPAVAKDIFVWIVGPRCSGNYFFRNNLTYLHTCLLISRTCCY